MIPGNWSSIKVPLSKYERGNLCALDFGPEMHSINDITFYFTDKQGKKLPIQLPYYNKVPATIPNIVKQIKQTGCFSAELDFSGTNSPENYGLIFNWPDGPAAKCNGDICWQEFPGPENITKKFWWKNSQMLSPAANRGLAVTKLIYCLNQKLMPAPIWSGRLMRRSNSTEVNQL